MVRHSPSFARDGAIGRYADGVSPMLGIDNVAGFTLRPDLLSSRPPIADLPMAARRPTAGHRPRPRRRWLLR
jgi:hypothetical protein